MGPVSGTRGLGHFKNLVQMPILNMCKLAPFFQLRTKNPGYGYRHWIVGFIKKHNMHYFYFFYKRKNM